MKKLIKILLAGLFLLPMLAGAAIFTTQTQTTSGFSFGSGGFFGGGGGLWGLLSIVMSILNRVVIILIALAVVFFLYGVLKFIISAGEVEKRDEGKKMMVWGIVGLFVMISFWGFVRILSNTFNLNAQAPFIPYFLWNGSGGGGTNNTNTNSTNSSTWGINI